MTTRTIRAISRDDAEDIATWRYPEPHTLHESSPDDAETLLDRANEYFVVVDEDDAIDWGTGMRPELTGQGHGVTFMKLVCDGMPRRWSDKPLRTTVATFNERWAHIVRRLGFQEVETFVNPAGREFVVYLKR